MITELKNLHIHDIFILNNDKNKVIRKIHKIADKKYFCPPTDFKPGKDKVEEKDWFPYDVFVNKSLSAGDIVKVYVHFPNDPSVGMNPYGYELEVPFPEPEYREDFRKEIQKLYHYLDDNSKCHVQFEDEMNKFYPED